MTTTIVASAAVLLLAAGFALTAHLIDRPEGDHRRPGRWSRAWWLCRDRAAWLGWRLRCAAWRISLLRWQLRRETWQDPCPSPDGWRCDGCHDVDGPGGGCSRAAFLPAPVTEEVMPSAAGQHDSETPGHGLRVTGRPGQPGKNMSDSAGLAGRGEPQGELAIARVAAPPAGGARPSPALPPAVTDVLPDAAIDAITGYLAEGWAIYHELAGQRYDTGAFERITAGA